MPRQQLSRAQALTAVKESIVLAVACLASYLLDTTLLSHVPALPHDDDLLGGMWAVIATIFVLRNSYEKSIAAALSRMAATLASFVLCLADTAIGVAVGVTAAWVDLRVIRRDRQPARDSARPRRS
jgi:hypothetical protein